MTSLRTERMPNEEVLRRLAQALPPGARTLCIGGYGIGDIGEEAALAVMIDELRSLGARPRVVSARPLETAKMHDVPASAPSLLELGRAVFEADALMICSGIFDRHAEPQARELPPLAGVATALRRRVIFRALGVDSATPHDIAQALVRAMQRGEFVSVRDQASADALRSFGLRRELVVEEDPALRLPLPTDVAPRDGRTVGLALRRVPDPDLQRRLECEFVALIDGLVGRGLVPLLLPFSRHPSEPLEQDDAYAQALTARSRTPTACRVAPPGLTPSQMLALVGSLDSMIAMRFHAIVFASLAGVPAVAIPCGDDDRVLLATHAMPTVEPSALTAEALLAALPETAASAA